MVVARPPGAERELDRSEIDGSGSSGQLMSRQPRRSVPISAFLGGLLATALAVKKVTGVLLDGRCRDLAELRALPLPVNNCLPGSAALFIVC